MSSNRIQQLFDSKPSSTSLPSTPSTSSSSTSSQFPGVPLELSDYYHPRESVAGNRRGAELLINQCLLVNPKDNYMILRPSSISGSYVLSIGSNGSGVDHLLILNSSGIMTFFDTYLNKQTVPIPRDGIKMSKKETQTPVLPKVTLTAKAEALITVIELWYKQKKIECNNSFSVIENIEEEDITHVGPRALLISTAEETRKLLERAGEIEKNVVTATQILKELTLTNTITVENITFLDNYKKEFLPNVQEMFNSIITEIKSQPTASSRTVTPASESKEEYKGPSRR